MRSIYYYVKLRNRPLGFNFFPFVLSFYFLFCCLPTLASAFSYDTLSVVNSSWVPVNVPQFHPNNLNSGDQKIVLFNPTTTYNVSEIGFAFGIGGIYNTDEKVSGQVQLLIYAGDGSTANLGSLLYTSSNFDLSLMGTLADRNISGQTFWNTSGILQDTNTPVFSFPSSITFSSGSSYVFVLHKVSTISWLSGGGYGSNGYCDFHDCLTVAVFSFYGVSNGSIIPKTSENSSITSNTNVSTLGTLSMRFGVGVLPDTSTRIITFNVSTTTNDIIINSHLYYNSTTTVHGFEVIASDIFGGNFFDNEKLATTTGDQHYTFTIPNPPSATSTEMFDTILVEGRINGQISYCYINGEFYNDFFHCGYYQPLVSTTTSLMLITNPAFSTIQNLIATSTCSIFSGEGLMGCFKNAMIWAFYPQFAIDQFSGLQDMVKMKAPVGYFFLVQSELNNINASSTPSFSFNVPDSIQTYIFNPFKLIFASLVWLFFIAHFYKRMKNLDI